jgi:hypothetical protein
VGGTVWLYFVRELAAAQSLLDSVLAAGNPLPMGFLAAADGLFHLNIKVGRSPFCA